MLCSYRYDYTIWHTDDGSIQYFVRYPVNLVDFVAVMHKLLTVEIITLLNVLKMGS